MNNFLKFVLLLSAAVWLTPSHAADCKASKPFGEMTVPDLQALYECLRPELIKGYQKRDNAIAAAYIDWNAASIAPQAPGMHSGQYLMTYVNPIGFDQYVKYRTEGNEMPVGTIIAKEAFTIKKTGKISKGPLLFMEKVGLEDASETAGWKYSGIKPNGKKLKVKAKDFCHACHQAWPGNDFLGYPLEAVRIKG